MNHRRVMDFSRGLLSLIGLQKDVSDSERATLEQLGITDLSGELKTWDDTAAVIGGLDLVLSVDSGPAHLSGALKVPTWVLLPAVADWRWGLSERCVWYPNTRLVRQL
jgi:ADP-heptose:LPS heptosyltransferase